LVKDLPSQQPAAGSVSETVFPACPGTSYHS
jgi:hypothetical protein